MRIIYKKDDRLIYVENSANMFITVEGAEAYTLNNLSEVTIENIRSEPERGRRFLTEARKIEADELERRRRASVETRDNQSRQTK